MPTAFFKIVNFGTGFLAAAASSSATAITLQAADMIRFPSAYPYRIVVDEEILEVTGRNNATNQLLVTRAQEGTAASSHLALALVSLRLTAEGIQRMYTAINALEQGINKVEIRVDGGLDAGQQPRVEFLSGANILVTAANDGPNNEVDVTLALKDVVGLLKQSSDPPAQPNKVLLYAKEVGGVTKLFLRESDGTIRGPIL